MIVDDSGTLAVALVCAWCKLLIRPGILPESHGICPACVVVYFPVDSRPDCDTIRKSSEGTPARKETGS